MCGYWHQFDCHFAGYDFTSKSVSKEKIGLTYHRIAEAFKFGFARRSELGDDDFVNVEEVRNLIFSPFKILKIPKYISPKHKRKILPSNSERTFGDERHACTYLNSFLMVIPNVINTFRILTAYLSLVWELIQIRKDMVTSWTFDQNTLLFIHEIFD